MPPITRKGVHKIMRRRTSTLQIQNTIKNNYLHLEKAKIYNKTTQETETIPNDKFMESFDFLCESGIFVDSIGWHYEKNLSENGEYIFDSGRMNPYAENVIIAHLQVNDGVSIEDVERTLKIEEE